MADAIDAIRAAGGVVQANGRDGKALKEASPPIEPAVLADAYVNYREWAPSWIVEGGLSIHAIVDNLSGYHAWVAGGRQPRTARTSNGATRPPLSRHPDPTDVLWDDEDRRRMGMKV